ncbi:transporter substrate-binding domain-containing protein [uncultured Dialister sp.]|uniref:transporter substrate-binding domain-containing protein n=1 Tax=uncultured Dialister sp. TaxID=278064 RepID=UPI0025DEC5CE|nr:transporter substrate-binding domain-containing protein [uncultured Dialister sp.]
MKRWMAAAAVLLAAGCLLAGGCGKDEPAAASASEGHVRIVTHANWNPFEYLKDGKITGFDIDLVTEAAKRAGLTPDITDAGWEAIFEQIRTGQADAAISGITITDDRKATYLFSKPYFVSRQAILIREDESISSAKDLMDGKTVAVQNGSTGQEALEKLMGKNNPAIRKTPMSIQMLIGGQVDALVGDETSVKSIQAQYPDQHLKIVYDDEAFTPEYFGILYPKDKGQALSRKMDKALSDMVSDGTYGKLYEKWFHTKPDEKMLASLKQG